MCSGSEASSYLRLIDFVYHSTLGVRVIKEGRKQRQRTSEASKTKCWVIGVNLKKTLPLKKATYTVAFWIEDQCLRIAMGAAKNL